MSQPPPLSPQLIGHLKAEAHAALCRQSSEQALVGVQEEREKLRGTRPVFAFLSSSKTKATFESTAQQLDQTERQVHERMELVDRIDVWVKAEIRRELDSYLTAASVEYQTLERLPVVLNRWRRGVGQLSESVLALARELKALSEPLGTAPTSAAAGLFVPLQSAVIGLAHRVAEVESAAKDFSQLTKGRLPESATLPPLPSFPDPLWVERLMVKGLAANVGVLPETEAASREFCRTGARALLDATQSLDGLCLQAKSAYLERYWDQLRAHTLQHLQGVGDPESVLADLERRMVTEQRARQTDALTRSPFAIAR